MPTKSYMFFEEYRIIHHAWQWWYDHWNTKKNKISWDVNKTTITRAELRMSVWTQFMCYSYVYFNQEQVLRCAADFSDVTCEITVDVTNLLINGSNEVKALLKAPILIPLEKSSVFTVELIITYEGDEPKVATWEDYLVPIALGAGTILTLYTVISIRRRR